ncbi:N-methyl-D-aspartate receptor NMDAR2C subunit [Thermodesulfobacteriota bacterium]
MSQIEACYREPRRVYHTLRHLGECLSWFDEARDVAARPAEVELAIWFHDAKFDTRRFDNEERSAKWAKEVLTAIGAAHEATKRISNMILATKHYVEPKGIDACLLVDIDLAILGAERKRFDDYEQQVRQEYAWVSDEHFWLARRMIIQEFLRRKRLYRTDFFFERLESAARSNLECSVDKLGAQSSEDKEN